MLKALSDNEHRLYLVSINETYEADIEPVARASSVLSSYGSKMEAVIPEELNSLPSSLDDDFELLSFSCK